MEYRTALAMRDNLKAALLAVGLLNDLRALAAGVTLTTRIPFCPTPGAGGGRCVPNVISSTAGFAHFAIAQA